MPDDEPADPSAPPGDPADLPGAPPSDGPGSRPDAPSTAAPPNDLVGDHGVRPTSDPTPSVAGDRHRPWPSADHGDVARSEAPVADAPSTAAITPDARASAAPVGAPAGGGAPPAGRPDDLTPRRPWVLPAIGLAIAAILVASVFSCTHSEPTLRPSSPPSTTAATSTTTGLDTASTGTVATPPSAFGAAPARRSQVATVKEGVDEVPVHDSASAAGDPSQTLPGAGEYGQRQVFLVIESDGPRLHVHLPVRPNGSQGWIDADLVEVHEHDYQIQVSLSGFRMIVQQGDEVVVDTPIGVGTEDTPTVGGDFYTWVLIDPTNAGYGSYAYGLSGFSTLEEFAGGDGRMGIHGTDDDSSIGRNVSHGCIRVPDDVVVRLVDDVGLPLGVPVTITA